MTTTIVQQLGEIRELVENDAAEALNRLNVILKKRQNADAHLLRLDILMGDFGDIAQMRESLDWLEQHRHNHEAFNALMSRFHATVEDKVDAVTDSMDDDEFPTDQLATLDSLIPLADRAPMIYIARGATLLHASDVRSRRRRPSFFEDTFGSSRLGGANPKVGLEAASLRARAKEDLQTALSHLADDDRMRGRAFRLLGLLYEQENDLVKAWRSYKSALDSGQENVEDTMEAVRERIIQNGSKQILDRADALLSHGRLDEAEDLLKLCDGVEPRQPFLVREADLALLRGHLDDAERLYQEALKKRL